MNPKTCLGLTISASLLLFASVPAAHADATNDEAQLIGVIQSQTSTPREKDTACVWLKHYGTAKSVPALAALLNNEDLSISARYALESMPAPEAGSALVTALAQTSGPLKAGVIESLGIRREPTAVPELSKLLADPDELIVRVSASSLGDIATSDAMTALEARLGDADGARRGDVIDGCLRCAQNLLAAGDHKTALAIYEKLYQQPVKEFYHVAAYRGMVLASGTHGVNLIADAITKGPASLQMEAVQLVHEKQIPGVTEAVAKLLPGVDPLVQVALIDALGQRDDPAATPAIVALVKQAAPDTRVAAVTALGTLGSDKEVSLLIDVASTAGDPAQAAARQSLGLVNRGNANKALLGLLPGSKPEAQVEIARALTSRSAVEATPELLRLAPQADPSVRDAVFEALARLEDQSQLEALVQLTGQMTTDADRASAAGALVAACRHIQRENGTVDMAPVWAALKNGSREARIALYPVCTSLVDPQAEAMLRAGVADSDAGIRAAAIHALCDATDAALLPDVEKLATDPSDSEFRTIAIESCVRLATQEESIKLANADRIKLFQAITPAASSDSEKRVVLSGLAAQSDAQALLLAEPFLTDSAVNNEAARAVIAISRTLPDDEAAKAALHKLLSQAVSDENRRDAEAALKLVDGRTGYVTTWQVAGPYRQKGKNFEALFDIAFPPETPGDQTTAWRVLPMSDDPKMPWAMDLLKNIGGEQVVAYARTSIHSDKEQSVWLLVNSDDGVKAWLNGQVVHANNISRAISGPPDKVQVTLKPGWNDLLLKVTQNNLGWGFAVRLTDMDGAQLNGLQYAAGTAQQRM